MYHPLCIWIRTNQELAKSSTRTSRSNYLSAGGLGRWGARAELLPSFSNQSISNHFPVQSPLAILLFNETNNKVRIKPTVFYQREISCFFLFVQRWIFTDAVMQCTSRIFRRLVRNLKEGINSNWQGYSPLTPNVKIAINKSRRTTQHFFPHAFRAKADSMCHMYPVEDCVNLGGTRVIYSNYHTRNMIPSALSI